MRILSEHEEKRKSREVSMVCVSSDLFFMECGSVRNNSHQINTSSYSNRVCRGTDTFHSGLRGWEGWKCLSSGPRRKKFISQHCWIVTSRKVWWRGWYIECKKFHNLGKSSCRLLVTNLEIKQSVLKLSVSYTIVT